MFTQSIPAPAPAPSPSSSGIHAATPTTPASPTSRTSRLRGLSYLRNYTQSHLLNREQNSSSGAASTSSTNNSSSNRSGLPSPSSPSPASSSLVRSDTYPLRQTQSATAAPISTSSSSSAAVTASAVDPRLFLEPAVSHPLSITSTNTSQSGLSDATPSQSRSQPPGEQSASSATAASAAVSSLQAAYRADQPSISDADNSATAAPLSTIDAVAPQSSSLTPAAAAVMTRSRSATEPGTGIASSNSSLANTENLPSIRFSTFYDPRATRPSLRFAPMARTLPTGSEVIRVGRYSERDSQPNANSNTPSAAHVGFKSKVVSRRHCEFWYENNQWYIRDVKSSSGTFLNHIRLSAPGTESKPYEVKDGDIVQLGIDFKGGEEMIFRCVKMRIELNRGWQSKLNPFNVNNHKRLRNLTKSGDADGSKQSSQDCSICLNSIACIRTLLETKNYPNFICPNCRMSVDLEADVEDPPEEWENMEIEEGGAANAADSSGVASESSSQHVKPRPSSDQRAGGASSPGESSSAAPAADVGDTTMQVDAVMDDVEDTIPLLPAVLAQQQRNERQELDSRLQQQILVEHQQQEDDAEPEPEIHVSHATSHPVPIPSGSRLPSGSGSAFAAANGNSGDNSGSDSARTPPSPTERHVAPTGHEGPITPRNDAGPWVFDGSGIRIGSSRASTDSRRGEMRNLDTAAAEISRHFHSANNQ
ncbi:hypothetical protein SEUCBS139899_006668 [Sporothrix eucalyptigena]|uniref:FHA domain-containing protein n=1 Tax=Sporothrix eucalyptigena TaxID=1812306 RepID=A0ABP0BAF1_9PEZI